MKNWRTIILTIIVLFIFWFIKFYFKFPGVDINIVGIILTIASILFGFLAGFFISELWSRYTEIRTTQSERCSSGVNLTKAAEQFFDNKKFQKEFKNLVEKSSIVDEVVEWDEGHLELPYYTNVKDSFRHIKIKNEKDSVYFENLLNNYNTFVECTIRLYTLGKERLFPSEWFVMIALSVIIALSTLFLDISHPFYRIIALAFPTIITLAMYIIYDLDSMSWSKEIISLEPNQKIFDALGIKRFYLSKKKEFISRHIKNYRTEKDLKGELKKVYLDILKTRKTNI